MLKPKWLFDTEVSIESDSVSEGEFLSPE